MASTDPHRPPTITGIACMGCYRGREQTYVASAVTPHETSRVLRIPALVLVS